MVGQEVSRLAESLSTPSTLSLRKPIDKANSGLASRRTWASVLRHDRRARQTSLLGTTHWIVRAQCKNETVPTYDLGSLIGCTVTRLAFDYQVRLLLSDGPYPNERVSAELVIEAPITFTEKGGVKRQVQPGDTRTVAPILGLFQRNVLSASFDGLVLTIVFDDQAVLEVPTSEAFQSWNLEGHGVPNLEAGPWSVP